MHNKFNDIFLKSKTVSEKAQRGYKIYTDKEKFQLVDATTVSEALAKSGIKDPYKIEVAGVIKRSIFAQSEISEKQATKAEIPVSQTPPATPPAENSAPAVQ